MPNCVNPSHFCYIVTLIPVCVFILLTQTRKKSTIDKANKIDPTKELPAVKV